MKRKIFSILFALVLAVSLMLVPANIVQANGTSTLTVNFPGVSPVHVYVRVDDGSGGTATGALVTSKINQTDSATFVLLKNTYDIVLIHGAKVKIVDAVDSTGDTATVSGIVSTLTVNFPGVSPVHVYVYVDDGNPGTATGGLVTSKTNQSGSATFTLLTNIYDVKLVKPGPVTEILDGVLVIALDIKPGNDPNSINPKSKGVIPVAILGHDAFDVTTVDVSTLDFEGASPAHDLTDFLVYTDHLQDVNGDGYTDLVSHYRTREASIAKGDTTACLTFDIVGYGYNSVTRCDSIKTVGK